MRICPYISTMKAHVCIQISNTACKYTLKRKEASQVGDEKATPL